MQAKNLVAASAGTVGVVTGRYPQDCRVLEREFALSLGNTSRIVVENELSFESFCIFSIWEGARGLGAIKTSIPNLVGGSSLAFTWEDAVHFGVPVPHFEGSIAIFESVGAGLGARVVWRK